jgi:hypothetical protein
MNHEKHTKTVPCSMSEFIVMMHKSYTLELWVCEEVPVHTLMVGGTPALSI